jgi:hypothetical protein
MSIIKSKTDPLALAWLHVSLLLYTRIPPKHDPTRLLHPQSQRVLYYFGGFITVVVRCQVRSQ